MEKDNKIIYPMMIELNETIKSDIYYISLPKNIKEKWIELEKNSSNKKLYNLPTITLKNILSSYLEGIIEMNVVSEYSDDTKWLVCFKEIDIDILKKCFSTWIDEFYMNGKIEQKSKRKNGSDEKVKELAEELEQMIKECDFQINIEKEAILFENGVAVEKNAFRLFPMKIIDSLIGKNISIQGKSAKLLYSNKNEIVTDTKVFEAEDDYYSFVIKLSVQTLPPDNKAYLNVDVSVRRWICRNENEEGTNYIGNNKNCYIRIRDDRMQCIKTQYSSEKKMNVWDDIDLRCFKECQAKGDIPNFVEVLKNPIKYNKGKQKDVLIPFQEGLRDIKTNVDNGITFEDRNYFFKFIKEIVREYYYIESNIEAINISKPVSKSNNDFYESKESININSEYFTEQLKKAVGGEKVSIEIFATGELRETLIEYLKNYLGDAYNELATLCDYTEIFDELEILGPKKNIAGFESRIEEISEELENTNKPTISFISIHDAKYYSKLKLNQEGKAKSDVDPKNAIRAGFAKTGRLTQFITFEEFEKQEENIESANEKYKKRKEKSVENGTKINKQNKTDNVNKALTGAILDGFRQLGVLFDYEANKKMNDKTIYGVHVCNYKTTLYGSIKPFPIIIKYDVSKSNIMAYCELVDKIEIPYWRAILGISKLSLEKDTEEVSRSISSTTINRRLDRIISKSDKNTVIIVEANGTVRKFLKGISNSKIQEVEKNEYNQIKKLLITDGKYLDLENENVSLIRIRCNEEVPSYLVDEKDDKTYLNTSGLFKYAKVYYSIDAKSLGEKRTYDKEESKALTGKRYSHRNMVEIYPMYISRDNKTHEKNEKIAVGIVHLLRGTSIQFTSQMTVLPLPLHLASKMEEYIR
jgi:hypothetical protein